MKAGAQAGVPVLQRATQQTNWGIKTISVTRYNQSVFPQHTWQTNTLIHHIKSIATANALFLPFSSALTTQKLNLTHHRRGDLYIFPSSCSSITKLTFASLSIKPTLFSLSCLTDRLDGTYHVITWWVCHTVVYSKSQTLQAKFCWPQWAEPWDVLGWANEYIKVWVLRRPRP